MPRQSIFEMEFAKVYPLLLAKVERKGRTKQELDAVITWLTGYDMDTLNQHISYAEFFEHAPALNPRASLIRGSVCGIRVESIEDPLMQKIRWLDKLVDELANGKPINTIMR